MRVIAPRDQGKIMDLPPGIVRIQMSQAVADALVQELNRVEALWARLDGLVVQPPPPGSAAFVDKNDTLRALAHDLAAMYLRASLDHLRAWRTLLHAGDVPIYAHMSLLRTAHESAFFALWLVEPGVSADERRARGVAAQLASYEERRKFEADLSRATPPQPPAQTATQRRTQLLALAEQQGLTKINRKGQAVLITQLLSAVELFERFEPVPADSKAKGSYLYRFHSGYAHAKPWALYQGAQRVAPFDATGRAPALVSSNDQVTLHATRRIINAVERAMAACEELHRPTN